MQLFFLRAFKLIFIFLSQLLRTCSLLFIGFAPMFFFLFQITIPELFAILVSEYRTLLIDLCSAGFLYSALHMHFKLNLKNHFSLLK